MTVSIVLALGETQERSQLTVWLNFCRLLMCWEWALLILRWQVRRGQTRTSLAVGLTLFTAVGLLALRLLLQAWQKPVSSSMEMRSLDAGSDSEKANCSRVSLKSVHIGKVIEVPRCESFRF